MLRQTFSNLAFFNRIVDMWNALPLSTRCAQRREWQISWLLDNLPNIKSKHWFIVPFAVGRLNCRIPHKL